MAARPSHARYLNFRWEDRFRLDDGASGWSGERRYENRPLLDGPGGWEEQISASTTSYDHTELSAGTTKYYRIRAHNSQGPGAWSDVASAITQANVPDKPALSATANGDTRIDLSWTVPADGGAPITRYELQVSDDGASGWSGLGGQISASTTSYDHTELSAATTKYYRIRAHNSQGPGAWSDVASAITQANVPDKPALSATANGRYENRPLLDGPGGWRFPRHPSPELRQSTTASGRTRKAPAHGQT